MCFPSLAKIGEYTRGGNRARGREAEITVHIETGGREGQLNTEVGIGIGTKLGSLHWHQLGRVTTTTITGRSREVGGGR